MKKVHATAVVFALIVQCANSFGQGPPRKQDGPENASAQQHSDAALRLLREADTGSTTEALRLLELARQELAISLSLVPEQRENHYLMACTLFGMAVRSHGNAAVEQAAGAIEHATKALKERPNDRLALLILGKSQYVHAYNAPMASDKPMYLAAVDTLTTLTKVAPEDALAHESLASALVGLIRHTNGAERAQLCERIDSAHAESVRLRPGTATALVMWATDLKQIADNERGDRRAQYLQQANEKFEAADKLSTGDVVLLINWGSLLISRAQDSQGSDATRYADQGIGKLRAALARDPEIEQARLNICIGYLAKAVYGPPAERARMLDQAENELLQLGKAGGASAYAFLNLARIHSMRGNASECRKWLQKVDALNALDETCRLPDGPEWENVRGNDWFQEYLKDSKGQHERL